MTELRGRSALVTGAARGLGAAIARALHAAGAAVVVADVDGGGAELVAAELGEGARAEQFDARNREAFAHLVESLDRVDILVNNAARTVPRPFFEIEQAEWDDVLATNLRSVLYGCQLVGTRMREQRFGRIVNVASLAGQQGGVAGGAHYAASKAGIVVLTKIVAQELAPYGVTCNAVAPAAIRTPALKGLSNEQIDAVRSRIPVGRLGEADEVASLALWLCSDAAGYVTGATYDINGGLFMR